MRQTAAFEGTAVESSQSLAQMMTRVYELIMAVSISGQ